MNLCLMFIGYRLHSTVAIYIFYENSNIVIIKESYCHNLQLYSWGGGTCLGCGSPEAVGFKPRLVEDLQATHIVDIACGDSHCLALTHGKILVDLIRSRI